ncbi:class D beta-lactamase [Oricola sp.]|uniref:class D beta-lactamase n=1 Tax=Oricola sp. TaxID=1979950 RepID=UPI003BAC116A
MPFRYLARRLALLSVVVCGFSAEAVAREACTVVLRADDGAEIHRSGRDCDTRFSPASTFKPVLALIGIEAGILTSPDAPAVAYDPAINARFEGWRQTTTPRRWLKRSVLWYSQWLTRQLGMQRFQAHIDRLDYGNRDLSGDPGKDNGLTHAWLGSSLKISPVEQAVFLRRWVNRELPLSAATYAMADEMIEHFETDDPGLDVVGKTGTAWAVDANGNRLRTQNGWFVGWAEKDGVRYVFARLDVENKPQKGIASRRTRERLLADLPGMLAARR